MTQPKTINILISIHPIYADKIMCGVKTIELRRKFPMLEGMKGRLLIYSTRPIQSVIGHVEIENVYCLPIRDIWDRFSKRSNIKKIDFIKYFKDLEHGYALELINPKYFKNPIPLTDLTKRYGLIAPQSYSYINKELEAIFNHV